MNERLTPAERIRKKSDFARLYREGGRFRGRYFTLVYRRNGEGRSRLGVVASRKVGSAVVRNRVRELFRRNKALLGDPVDLIVIARPEAGEAAWAEFREAYRSSLDKILRKRITP